MISSVDKTADHFELKKFYSVSSNVDTVLETITVSKEGEGGKSMQQLHICVKAVDSITSNGGSFVTQKYMIQSKLIDLEFVLFLCHEIARTKAEPSQGFS